MWNDDPVIQQRINQIDLGLYIAEFLFFDDTRRFKEEEKI
jgi:hypothetical protein